jgi:hypothetical protein
VPTGVAEHVVQQPAGAIDHRRLSNEAGRGRHEPEHGQDAFDAIERSELRLEDRERVERAPTGRFGALLDGDLRAEDPGVDELAVVVAGELPRRAGPTAVDHHRIERLVGRKGTGQDEPELREALPDGWVHRSQPIAVMPPSTVITAPFTYDASTAVKAPIMCAISSGVP